MAERLFPELCQVVIDTDDVRGLAEFYRALLGFRYRAGDEPPTHGVDDADWLVLLQRDGSRVIAIQQAREHRRSTWPETEVPQQMHLDLAVATVAELERQRERVLSLGGTLILDRRADPEEPLYAFADPAGHPFCIFVAPREG